MGAGALNGSWASSFGTSSELISVPGEIESKETPPAIADSGPLSHPIMRSSYQFIRRTLSRSISFEVDKKEESKPHGWSERLLILSRCNLPTLANSASAREAYLQFLEKSCFHCFDALGKAVIRKEFGTGVFFTKARRLSVVNFIAFLDSPTYSEWCQSQLGTSIDMNGQQLERTMRMMFANTESDCETVYTLVKKYTIPSIPSCAFLIKNKEWFRPLIEAVENLPVIVMISLADAQRDFPIVYANEHAEAAAGKSRAELFGKPNWFFNSLIDHKQQIGKAVPVMHRSFQSFYQKESSPFISISKPIFDSTSRHRFILSAILADGEEENLRTMQMFILFMPNTFHERTLSL